MLAVGGNHDGWAKLLIGIDYFREVLGHLSPNTLYDSDDSRVLLTVGQAAFRLRLRHKWQGSSIYNPTHGAERAAKWDQDFDVAVGAHTHSCGVARGFSVGGRSGLAVQVGAYKRVDPFAKQEGFARPNQSTAIGVLFTDQGEMVGFESLRLAASFLHSVYR